MKCIKCNAELSNSVYRVHIKNCNANTEVVKEIIPEVKEELEPEVIKSEKLEIKPTEYTLEQLLQMCLEDPNRKESPSTIKRWKEERLRKELNL